MWTLESAGIKKKNSCFRHPINTDRIVFPGPNAQRLSFMALQYFVRAERNKTFEPMRCHHLGFPCVPGTSGSHWCSDVN
jgi:hypothetical protein